MSGHKCSEFHLQQERAARLTLLQSIARLRAEVTGLKARTAALLASASDGLRSTFSEEVEGAEGWLRTMVRERVAAAGSDAPVTALRSADADLQRVALQGRLAWEGLTLAFTQKADATGQRLSRRLTDAEQSYVAHQELLVLWLGAGRTQEWESTLQECRRMLADEQYAALEARLDDTARAITGGAARAVEQEEQHQKRLYLLKALRQVCAEMGFREISEPGYEREGNRAGSILFSVDTLDRGAINFTLALDRIGTFSEIGDDHCFEEFGQLSRHLQDRFGIQTAFSKADGEPPPRLVHKTERDRPEDTGLGAKL